MIPSPGQLYRHRRDGRVAMVVALSDTSTACWWHLLRMVDTGREVLVYPRHLVDEWERVRLVSVEVEAWVPKKRSTTPIVKENDDAP